MRHMLLLVAAVFSVGASGCLHVKADLPGTLDLRSDGSDAPMSSDPMGSEVSRDGISSFFLGSGAHGSGDVVIEDRNHYLIAFLPLFNDGPEYELQSAVGNQALRNVSVGDNFSLWAFGDVFCKSMCIISMPVNMSWDFHAKGTRIITTGGTHSSTLGVTPPSDPSSSGSIPGPESVVPPSTGY